jgi:hypothetical protein
MRKLFSIFVLVLAVLALSPPEGHHHSRLSRAVAGWGIRRGPDASLMP